MYSWHTRKKGWIGAGLDPRQHAVVAEWLRRLTRNQFRSAGVGSNPTDRVTIFTPKFVITLSIIIFNQVYCSKNPVSTVNSGGCSVVQLAKLVRLFQIWSMDNCLKWA